MKKFCFYCWSRIPLLASRCPNCINDDQTIYGRLFLIILLLIGFFVGGKYYLHKKGVEERQRIEQQYKNSKVLKSLKENYKGENK